MDQTVPPIKDSAKLTSFFGEWPSFHDAEILKVEMERNQQTMLTLKIFAFKTNRKETDEKGYFKRTNKCVVTLRFHKITDVLLEGFNQQNVVADIVFQKRGEQRIAVLIEGIYGLYGKFLCESAEVVEATPSPD